jgi:hypothetical protein
MLATHRGLPNVLNSSSSLPNKYSAVQPNSPKTAPRTALRIGPAPRKHRAIHCAVLSLGFSLRGRLFGRYAVRRKAASAARVAVCYFLACPLAKPLAVSELAPSRLEEPINRVVHTRTSTVDDVGMAHGSRVIPCARSSCTVRMPQPSSSSGRRRSSRGYAQPQPATTPHTP